MSTDPPSAPPGHVPPIRREILVDADPATAFAVFTERIDWVGGEDPQEWAVLPLTGGEAERVRSEFGTAGPAALGTVGTGRPCLRRAYPVDGEPAVGWSTGPVWLGPYG